LVFDLSNEFDFRKSEVVKFANRADDMIIAMEWFAEKYENLF
jgi:hypothetical protein